MFIFSWKIMLIFYAVFKKLITQTQNPEIQTYFLKLLS